LPAPAEHAGISPGSGRDCRASVAHLPLVRLLDLTARVSDDVREDGRSQHLVRDRPVLGCHDLELPRCSARMRVEDNDSVRQLRK
jgi:hypothetical protein